MKKLKLLVAPLLVLPFVIGCNNGGGDKPGEVKFSLSSDQPITVKDKTATVNVDWTPNDIIKFESFTFSATPTKPNSVTFDPTSEPRPMPVTITFENDITEDISGTLSFEYEDVTAKSKGESSIKIAIPKPDPTVTQEEFSHAINFDGIKRMQANQEDNVTLSKQTATTQIICETSELVCHFIQIQKVGAAETANETYAKIENVGDERCLAVDRKSETEWYEPREVYSYSYPFVSSYYNPINKLKSNYKNFEPALEYNNFSVADDKYNYQGTAKNSLDKDVSVTIAFSFKNKVLVNYSLAMDQPEVLTMQTNIAYTFEDLVPTWPL